MSAFVQASRSVHSGTNLLLVDVRDETERMGGEIPSSVRTCGQLHDPAMSRVGSEWRRGRTVVFYCTRSLSRAPAAAHLLIRQLEAGAAGSATAAASGPPARDAAGRIERLAVLSGGICAYLQHVLLRLAECGAGYAPGAGGAADVAAFVADFDPDMWLLAGAAGAAGGEQIAHVSEHPEVLAERRAARALADDGETSDELAFLVTQRCSLSPQSASSMPYIS